MKYLLLHLCLLIAFVSNAQTLNTDCLADYKIGTFSYEGKENEVQIIRTKNQQIEIFNNGKSKAYLKIEWKNDSTYVLTLTKVKNVPNAQIGQEIVTRIISCEGGRYVCTYTAGNTKGECVIVKLKK
jgi:uncharacterized protein YxeA